MKIINNYFFVIALMALVSSPAQAMKNTTNSYSSSGSSDTKSYSSSSILLVPTEIEADKLPSSLSTELNTIDTSADKKDANTGSTKTSLSNYGITGKNVAIAAAVAATIYAAYKTYEWYTAPKNAPSQDKRK